MALPAFVLRNGALIAPDAAQISIFNPALSGSYGIYESLQVVAGVPFAEAPHLRRLAHSAALIDLPLPADFATLSRWMRAALQANQVRDCVLRIYVLGPENGGEPAVYIWPAPIPAYPASFYTNGATAITFAGERFLPEAKTLNTLVSFLAQRRAAAAGVHEALLCHDGCVTEGSNSNLFVVLDGVLTTAPQEQALAGVARDMVLAAGARRNAPVQENTLALADLPRWSECFITSTSRHVMPITAIDGRPVGDGRVGLYTRRVMDWFEEDFRQMVAAEAGRA